MTPVSPSPSPIPMKTSDAGAEDPCPLCCVSFQDRDVGPVVVTTRCNHRFDPGCVAQWLQTLRAGSRTCAVCRQSPMPLKGLTTGKEYPDHFFPDNSFFEACSTGDQVQVHFWLRQGVNVNAAKDNDVTALMSASQNGHKAVAELLRQGLVKPL